MEREGARGWRWTAGGGGGGLAGWLAMAGVVALLVGCGQPAGAKRVTGRLSYQELHRSALDSAGFSTASKVVLHRFGLMEEYARDPAAALDRLHERALTDGRRDLLFALAELSFHQGERLLRSVKPGAARAAPDRFLSSAIYAYLFLLGDGGEPAPDPFERRFRLACDLYNRAVAQGFMEGRLPDREVVLREGLRRLGPGPVQVRLERQRFRWDFAHIEAFLPADEFSLRGLTVRDRRDGLGSPLIVVGRQLERASFARRFPATLFLRVPEGVRGWSEGRLEITLELVSTYDHETVDVEGREIRLEGDTTAPLAYGLEESSSWRLDWVQFFSAEERIRSGVYLSQPYRRGLIPVVFVHGTASSPERWAEMWNTLRTDAALRERYQYWYYIYNSGQALSLSANRLREELGRKVKELDPGGADAALKQMVVVGHSQGGLLAKLLVTETGERLWRAVSTNDLGSSAVPAELRGLWQSNFVFTPVPWVSRVVFIATPHRGSYRAKGLVRMLARRLVRLPQTVVVTSVQVLQFWRYLQPADAATATVPTSVDSMSPKNRWLLALAEIPVTAGVKAHSIVAVRGREVPPAGGDGVVKYESAHVPYVESELVIRDGHGCQDHPAAIEEVRRILLQHVAEGRKRVLD